MTTLLTDLFRSTNPRVQPPTDLLERVISRIQAEEARLEARRKRSLGIISLAALTATIATGWYAIGRILASDLIPFLSLAFTDSSAVAHAWKAFGLSLLEALPTFAVAVFIGSACVFLWSIRSVLHNNIRSARGLRLA